MQLYILRHGIADDGKPGTSDEDRALTKEGIEKLRATLRTADKADVFPTLILSSPYKRAVQTAELAMNILGCREPLVLSRALVPDSDPEAVWTEVRVHQDEEQLMLVGHEPLFSQLVSYLLASPALLVDVKKGSIVRIDFDSFGSQPRGILKWMLSPKLAS